MNIRPKAAHWLVKLASRIDRRPHVRYSISHDRPPGWSKRSYLAHQAIKRAPNAETP